VIRGLALRPCPAMATCRWRSPTDGSPSTPRQPLHRPQRLPTGDGPGPHPRLRIVGAGEPPAQLDGGREFAALLVDGADRSGIRLGDDEHRWSMGVALRRVELLWLGAR
jgi:hypothetical protein